MESVKTELYEGHQLTVIVEKRDHGPFPGAWFVRSQTIRQTPTSAAPEVAHEQSDGPCGSEELAFDKAFGTLRRFVDANLSEGSRQSGLHRDVSVGPYHLAINAVQKYDKADAARIVGYNVRVMISRPDKKPVQGAFLMENSEEMTATNGRPYPSVSDALDAGEAWGRLTIKHLEKSGGQEGNG